MSTAFPRPPFDTAETDRLLSTTRAVRRKLDLDRPVEPDVILECLRLAVQAPTASSDQRWRWLVVRDAGIRAELGRLFRTAGDAYFERKLEVLGDAVEDPAVALNLASGRQLIEIIERVPVLVIPCILGRPEGDNAALSVFYGSIFPAVWNFQLALRSRGLGSTLTSYHLEHEEEAARILGVPDDVTQVGLLPIAYTTVTDFKPANRQPVEELTYVDTWGTPPGV